MVWEKLKCLGRKISKIRDIMELAYSRFCFVTPKHHHLKEKGKDAPILLAEERMEKTASCLERQNDEWWNKEENQHEGHRGSGSQSQVEMGRSCSRNGAVQTGARNIMRRKIRQKENRTTEDLMGRHVPDSSRRRVVTNGQEPEYRTLVKSLS